MNKQEQKMLEKAASFLLIEGQKMRQKHAISKRRAQEKLKLAHQNLENQRKRSEKFETLILEMLVRQDRGCVHEFPDLCENPLCEELSAKLIKKQEKSDRIEESDDTEDSDNSSSDSE